MIMTRAKAVRRDQVLHASFALTALVFLTAILISTAPSVLRPMAASVGISTISVSGK
jgi:hypothetical protein